MQVQITFFKLFSLFLRYLKLIEHSLLRLAGSLCLFNVDLFTLFGASQCDFGTGFYPSFMFSFLLFPMVIGGALISYGAVRLIRKLFPSSVDYTTESARTRLYTFLFIIHSL